MQISHSNLTFLVLRTSQYVSLRYAVFIRTSSFFRRFLFVLKSEFTGNILRNFTSKSSLPEREKIAPFLVFFTRPESDDDPVGPVRDTQEDGFQVIVRIREHTREKAVVQKLENQFLLYGKIPRFIAKRSLCVDSSLVSQCFRNSFRDNRADKGFRLDRLQSLVGGLEDLS